MAGSFTITWVTAPMMRPSWIRGLPDMPCTMPPVLSSSAGSVTRTTMARAAGCAVSDRRTISQSYSPTPPPSTVVSSVAGPVWICRRVAAGSPSGYRLFSRGSAARPNMPYSQFRFTLPSASVSPRKSPVSSPGAPSRLGVTSTTRLA